MYKTAFLDNAYQGRNNWWRFILTTILTWIGLPILAIIIMIPLFIIIYSIDSGMNLDQLDTNFSDPLSNFIIFGIYYIVSFLLFYLCIHIIHHKKLIYLLNTASNVNWMRMLKGACIWFVILGLVTILDLIIDPASAKLSFNPNTFFILLISCLIIFPIQASLEELFFRGYLMQGIGLLTKKPIIPLLITSIIFAILHYWNSPDPIIGIITVFQMFIFGTTLGIITLGENGLETAMGVHIANNIFVTAIFNNPDDIFGNLPAILTAGSDPTMGVPFFVPPLALLVIIFWNKKNRLYNIFKTRDEIRGTNLEIHGVESFKTELNHDTEYSYHINGISTHEIQCFNCYTLNPSEAVYCKECGTKIETPEYIYPNETAIQCFNCHALNSNEMIYCMECGTKIVVEYASTISKLLASVIDLIVMVVVFVVLLLIVTILTPISSNSETLNEDLTFKIWIALDFIVFFIYFILFGKWGQTIGKKIMGIKIVDEFDQNPITYTQSIIRNLLLTIDLIPYLIPGLLGIITGIASNKKQRIGDMAAKTIVIKKR